MLVVWESVVCGSVLFIDPLLCFCYCFNFFCFVGSSGMLEIKKKFGVVLNKSKNLVGPDSQGKSQSQDFIDEFRGLGHTLVQIVNLACWYPLSVTDCVPCRSFLLLSVLQIVDSRPSWMLASVLGEICYTSRIADVLPT